MNKVERNSQRGIKVEMVKGTAFELDPNKNYLICFDRNVISSEEVHMFMNRLKISNASVAIMINGDPSTAVKVIEANA